MSKLTDALNSWFRRRKVRPVTPEDAADLADWANEGGAIDPQGPPPVTGRDEPPRA